MFGWAFSWLSTDDPGHSEVAEPCNERLHAEWMVNYSRVDAQCDHAASVLAQVADGDLFAHGELNLDSLQDIMGSLDCVAENITALEGRVPLLGGKRNELLLFISSLHRKRNAVVVLLQNALEQGPPERSDSTRNVSVGIKEDLHRPELTSPTVWSFPLFPQRPEHAQDEDEDPLFSCRVCEQMVRLKHVDEHSRHCAVLPSGGVGVSLAQRLEREDKLEGLLAGDAEGTVDAGAVRSLASLGVSDALRPNVWRLCLGYLPARRNDWEGVLGAHRETYAAIVRKCSHSVEEKHLRERIAADVPRTFYNVPFFRRTEIQEALTRVTLAWAVTSTDLQYVQGMTSLAAPFILVFLQQRMEDESGIDACDLEEAEGDAYWCLVALLQRLHDNYTDDRGGIIRSANTTSTIVHLLNPTLFAHLENEKIDFVVLVFPWLTCLFAQDLPLARLLRVWDALFAANDMLALLPFLCASFLCRWTASLRLLSSADMLRFLQDAPATEWKDEDVAILLSDTRAARQFCLLGIPEDNIAEAGST